MGVQHVDLITSAVAPIVMVSAAGLLFMGVQTKNLHLSDRIRTLMAEYRALTPKPADEARRQQILQQVVLFNRRIRLSQRSLELLYIAIVCFVLTSLFLAAAPWVGRFFMPVGTAGVCGAGISFARAVDGIPRNARWTQNHCHRAGTGLERFAEGVT